MTNVDRYDIILTARGRNSASGRVIVGLRPNDPISPASLLKPLKLAAFFVSNRLHTWPDVCHPGRAPWSECKVPEAPDDPCRREIKIKFGNACDGCPAHDLCTSSKTGRTLTVSAFYAELSARRAEQQTDEFKERLKRRSAVEGTISELTRCHDALQS
ncbi:MAG: transposase [Chloroflexi bacterium]|nr:transposase [Chloroflexota bacterium]